MTATYNPDEVERLVREAMEDDARMTPGPWTEPDGKRLRGAVNALVGGVQRQVAQASAEAPSAEDDLDYGPNDIAGPRLLANASGIARTRNNLRALADQLEAARTAIENLEGMERAARAIRLAESHSVLRQEQELDAARHKIELDGITLAMLNQLTSEQLAQLEVARAEIERMRTECNDAADRDAELYRLRADLVRLRSELDTATAARSFAETRANNLGASHTARDATKLRIATRLGLGMHATQTEIAEAVDRVMEERDGARTDIVTANAKLRRLYNALCHAMANWGKPDPGDRNVGDARWEREGKAQEYVWAEMKAVFDASPGVLYVDGKRCSTCGKLGCRPMEHAGWDPSKDRP